MGKAVPKLLSEPHNAASARWHEEGSGMRRIGKKSVVVCNFDGVPKSLRTDLQNRTGCRVRDSKLNVQDLPNYAVRPNLHPQRLGSSPKLITFAKAIVVSKMLALTVGQFPNSHLAASARRGCWDRAIRFRGTLEHDALIKGEVRGRHTYCDSSRLPLGLYVASCDSLSFPVTFVRDHAYPELRQVVWLFVQTAHGASHRLRHTISVDAKSCVCPMILVCRETSRFLVAHCSKA